MKQKPRWTLEMLTACLAILCVLLMLVLLVQRPAIWPVLVVLAAGGAVHRHGQPCSATASAASWHAGSVAATLQNRKQKFSLEPLSQPVASFRGNGAVVQ